MKKRWKWLVAFLPTLVGVLVALLVVAGRMENHRIYLVGRVSFVAPFVGILFTFLIALILLLQREANRRLQRDLSRFQKETSEERRRFLRRLDHELKNPLTAIRAGLANLAWLPSTEARQETVGGVDAQAQRLGRLASDLRKLADLEVRPLELAPVNVALLLEEAVEIAQERPKEDGRRISLSVPQAPWPLPTIEGDRDLLFLAVHNLVDNACKFTAVGDTIEIRAFEDGARLVIEIADTGPGIPEEDLPHVWDELYRGKGARGIPGSGLGLALVKAIVERHSGRVSVRSRTGQGTVFTLQLPV